MAKGDSGRAQNQINNQGTTAQSGENAVMNNLFGQNMGFQNNYNAGANTDFMDYNQGQDNYAGFLSGLQNGQIGVGTGTTFGSPMMGGPSNTGSFSYSGNPTDPQAEASYVHYLSTLPGADPTLATDPNYWIGKINETGGLTDSNIGYWNNRSKEGAGNAGGGLNGALDSARGTFQNFADTGGFSPQDIQDIRSRSTSAMRSTYQNMQHNLDQNRELQQFSPNYAAASAKMARDMGYGLSDAATNADASIAQLIQQGKLAGAQGLTGVAGQNSANQQMNLQDMLSAMSGSTSLYGATPGMSSTFGSQLNTSSGLLNQAQGQQDQLGLGLINAQIGKSQIPGDFQQAMSNVGSVLKPVAGVASMFAGNPFGMGSGSGLDFSTLSGSPYTVPFGTGGTMTFGNSNPWG